MQKNAEKMKLKRTAEAIIREVEFLTEGEACIATVWSTPGLEAETVDNSGFSAEET